MKYIFTLALDKISAKRWKLKTAFAFSYGKDTYVINGGFETDLATVPYPVSLWLKPDGEYKESAVIHDYLLCKMYKGNKDITRKFAAKVFLASLIYQSVPWYEVALLYGGVRLYDLYQHIKKDVL